MERIDMIAIDGSRHSRLAFDWYLENIFREGVRLILIHIAEYGIDIALPGAAADVDAICAAVKKRNDEIGIMTEEYMSELRARQIPARLMTLTGNNPGEIIVKTAMEEKVGSIILGTRGLGTFSRMLLGSVSEYVIHNAHCPVTIVRQSE